MRSVDKMSSKEIRSVLSPPAIKPRSLWFGLFLGLLSWGVLLGALWLVWSVLE